MIQEGSGEYCGQELEIFADARRWRSYWFGFIRQYLGPEVLEVGAGLGSVTRFASTAHVGWTAVEPDESLARRIREGNQAASVRILAGTIDAVPRGDLFDSVLYADVLEHIENDAEELEKAFRLVRPGGHLIVLSPAHAWLYSRFDAGVGHFRRYSIESLVACTPTGGFVERVAYLDSVGLIASAANRFLLRSTVPSQRQIAIWDRLMIPMSRWLDKILRWRVGKSVVVVWRKQ